MFLEITIIFLSFALIILSFLFYQQKKSDKSREIKKETKPKEPINHESETNKIQEQQIAAFFAELGNSAKEIQALKELILTNFADNRASLRERFDYLDKSFTELNKVFYSSKRGMLGNSYLNELLSITLPQDNQIYQLVIHS